MTESITYAKARKSFIKRGDLIEFGANTALGAAIRWKTKQKVNHSAIATWMVSQDTGCYAVREISDTAPRLYVAEALTTFRMTFLSAKVENFDGEIYWSQLKPEFAGKRALFLHYLFQMEGKDYDWLSLARNLYRRVPLDDKRPYCSEAVQIASLRAGMHSFDKYGLWPGELHKLGIWQEPILITQ